MCPFLMQKNKGELRMHKKINKKTVFILVLLIATMMFSVFAITNTILTNQAVTDTNISPYAYRMVVAYFAYWKSGDSYYADINGVRTNIGQVPYQKFVPNYEFPVALIPGNYAIDDIMNYKDYIGSVSTWEELNYSGLSQVQVEEHYMNTAVVENTPAVIGAMNTTVTLIASYKPLNPGPNMGFDPDPYGRYAYYDGKSVYYSYIAIVIKYKNLDYVEPPEEPEEPEEPGDDGNKKIMVYVWNKEKDTNKDLADLQKVWTSMGSNLVLSNQSIDGYKCVGSSIKGLSTKDYETGYINEVVGRQPYSTPDDGYIYVTFYQEKGPKPPDYRCDPQFDADAEGVRITMKRSDFEKATELYFEDVHTEINETKFGWKDGVKMPGQHDFAGMDIYFKYGDSTGYDFQHNGIHSKKAKTSLNVPKVKFEPTNPEKTEYRMTLGVQVGVWCICDGFEVDKTSTSLYVDIIENQPPDANYEYSTVKTLPSGQESRVYNKAYIGKDIIIDNYCTDPNGTRDIDYIIYTFTNSSGQVKSLKFKMQPWIEYTQLSADNFSDTSIIYKGSDNGNLNVVFTTDEEWNLKIYVQDKDGLNDIYTNTIKLEELTLKPTAVIKDEREYTYPYGQLFNGKQNRVIKVDSNNSYVASWLYDMDVTIDHTKDMWSIETLGGQDINSVKFEKDINKIISGNLLTARYEPLNTKIMFKETGMYKIKLQVTDTEGNTSDWTEQIITIHPDLEPEITANITDKIYRNSAGTAYLYLFGLNVKSSDLDNAYIYYVGYKYDSNNDGSFKDEDVKAIPYSNEESIALPTKELGKYQFIIIAKEEFGQEAISKHIVENDYRTASLTLYTEVDNVAPNINKFKIITLD